MTCDFMLSEPGRCLKLHLCLRDKFMVSLESPIHWSITHSSLKRIISNLSDHLQFLLQLLGFDSISSIFLLDFCPLKSALWSSGSRRSQTSPLPTRPVTGNIYMSLVATNKNRLILAQPSFFFASSQLASSDMSPASALCVCFNCKKHILRDRRYGIALLFLLRANVWCWRSGKWLNTTQQSTPLS